jgi:hypothetical protein
VPPLEKTPRTVRCAFPHSMLATAECESRSLLISLSNPHNPASTPKAGYWVPHIESATTVRDGSRSAARQAPANNIRSTSRSTRTAGRGLWL